MVQFMLMMHVRRDEVGSAMEWSADDLARMIDFQRAFDRSLEETGEMVFNAGLSWPDEARLVRNEGGEVVVADGPFADGREFLIGFWIVDCESAERAHAIAGRASASPGPGGQPMGIPIEVRALSGPPSTDD
jgi:hypothetical protein